jgi:hypothetical protein
MKQTLLAKLVEKKLIVNKAVIEVDYVAVTEDGATLPKKRTKFNVTNVVSSPLHPAMELTVVNTDDGSEAVIYSYEILTINGLKPQRFAVANGVNADGIERMTKRRGRKPKIRDTQE